MKQNRRCTRISILSLLSVSVLLPIFLLSSTLRNFKSEASEEYIEDLSTIKYRTDALTLSSIEEKDGESVEEPPLVVYKDGVLGSEVADISSNGSSRSDRSENARISTDIPKRNGANQDAKQDYQQVHLEKPSLKQSEQATVRGNRNIQAKVQGNRNIQALTRRVSDEKVKEIKDQLIRANAYLELAPPGSKSQLVRELRLRIRMLERAVGESSKDSDLSPGALHRIRAMEATLTKASRVYADCPAMVSKLRAMTYNLEEQARAQKSQVQFLLQLAGRTTPKGLHCLSMRLTAEYFALQPEEWQFPNQQKLHDPDLYHFAVFSDNVLACAVVVNSTISTSKEPEKLVFHVVTDSLNLPAMSMWFLLNPPGKSAMQIQSVNSFEWLSTKYNATLQKENSPDLRYTSALNHLRFYLPDVFPMLNKIVLLDHDVVVQRDLTGLWNISMEGKVNGAVETCQEGEASFRRMDMFVNFSDPSIEKRFDREACTWAFGMNVFDLREWWRHNLTGVYHNYLQLGDERPLWKAGSLPLGWVTFYNHTMALDRTWHILGLGHDSGVRRVDIEQAAVIHFNGIMKPWLDTGPDKYKEYWRRHVNYGHPYLQQCNIQR
ncbi:probable galacturonosyltransferase 6 isoform X2 [Rhododendron vialii]|uniref:probable galacturonosyltransferase 6 isoform X2 n=1 Tax=Rhododendron vialii TaxID=182163 RepID=UPI00265EACDE|nr:probable galacturonosyltransferase 6 isoform X2 [Rhododendron vialii]